MVIMKIDINETDQKKIQSVIEGLVTWGFENITFLDEDNQATKLKMLTHQVRTTYISKITKHTVTIDVPTVDDTEKEIQKHLLDPEQGMPIETQTILQTKLRLPPESA